MEDLEISFTKRISKMGPHRIITIPKDRHDDFEHSYLIKVILLKKKLQPIH